MPKLQALCNTGVHCQTCRATTGDGPGWRKAVEAHYTLPDGWPDCPHGKPWDVVACNRCGGGHDVAACPIHPQAKPTRADALAGGGCCDPPPSPR